MNRLKTIHESRILILMRAKTNFRFLLLLLSFLGILFSITSCKKVTEEFQTEDVSEYMPLQVGKYITYRLDSLVFTNGGRTQETHSYQVKHVVNAEITDNLGRPSFRIYRYLRDLEGLNPWQPNGSYLITAAKDQIEVIENNLRAIKLHAPIATDFTWKGNRYLAREPYQSLFTFSNDDNMNDWEYHYEKTNDTIQFNQQMINNVLKIVEVEEIAVMDTVNIANNKATIPLNTEAVFVRGSATDTVIINVPAPNSGFENLTIYNQTNYTASLNGIIIPQGLALSYEYENNSWGYPNRINVENNRASYSRNVSVGYIIGTASDSIKVDVSRLDTFGLKKITIYNKSNKPAYLNGKEIPVGFGREYNLLIGTWTSESSLVDKDPFLSEMAFGQKSYSVEKYAKGIGLVFKEFILWEYQPLANPPYTAGFGIKLTMIDHN